MRPRRGAQARGRSNQDSARNPFAEAQHLHAGGNGNGFTSAMEDVDRRRYDEMRRASKERPVAEFNARNPRGRDRSGRAQRGASVPGRNSTNSRAGTQSGRDNRQPGNTSRNARAVDHYQPAPRRGRNNTSAASRGNVNRFSQLVDEDRMDESGPGQRPRSSHSQGHGTATSSRQREQRGSWSKYSDQQNGGHRNAARQSLTGKRSTQSGRAPTSRSASPLFFNSDYEDDQMDIDKKTRPSRKNQPRLQNDSAAFLQPNHSIFQESGQLGAMFGKQNSGFGTGPNVPANGFGSGLNMQTGGFDQPSNGFGSPFGQQPSGFGSPFGQQPNNPISGPSFGQQHSGFGTTPGGPGSTFGNSHNGFGTGPPAQQTGVFARSEVKPTPPFGFGPISEQQGNNFGSASTEPSNPFGASATNPSTAFGSAFGQPGGASNPPILKRPGSFGLAPGQPANSSSPAFAKSGSAINPPILKQPGPFGLTSRQPANSSGPATLKPLPSFGAASSSKNVDLGPSMLQGRRQPKPNAAVRHPSVSPRSGLTPTHEQQSPPVPSHTQHKAYQLSFEPTEGGGFELEPGIQRHKTRAVASKKRKGLKAESLRPDDSDEEENGRDIHIRPTAKAPSKKSKGPVGKKFTPGPGKDVEARFAWFQKHRDDEKRYLIANGTYTDPDKQIPLSEAITLVGTCEDMCPEFERVKRAARNEIWVEESVQDKSSPRRVMDESRMVKKFARSAAGMDEQLPSDLRPPLVLRKTLDYLIHDVLADAPAFGRVHHFLWDRTRSIRNDFSIQSVETSPSVSVAIDCFERILRFHLISLHTFSRPEDKPYPEFTAQQEREQLAKTKKSLEDYYQDSGAFYRSPNFNEMTAIRIILSYQESQGCQATWVRELGRDVYESPQVQTALKLARYISDTEDEHGSRRMEPAPFKTAPTNYARFWSLIKSPSVSFIMGCAAEITFPMVRWRALRALFKATYRPGHFDPPEWTLEDLKPHLGFDTPKEVKDFLNSCRVRVSASQRGPAADFKSIQSQSSGIPYPTKPAAPSGIVERKRCGRPYPALIDAIPAKRCNASKGAEQRNPNRVPDILEQPYTYDQAVMYRDLEPADPDADFEAERLKVFTSRLPGYRIMTRDDVVRLSHTGQLGATQRAQPSTAAKPSTEQPSTASNVGKSLFDRVSKDADNESTAPASQSASPIKGNSLFDRVSTDGPIGNNASTSQPAGLQIKGTAQRNEEQRQLEAAAAAKLEAEQAERAKEQARLLAEQQTQAAEKAARERAKAEQKRRQEEAARLAQEAENQRKQEEALRAEAEERERGVILDNLAFKMVTEREDGFFDQFIASIAGPMVAEIHQEMIDAKIQRKLRKIRVKQLMRKYARKWRKLSYYLKLRRIGNERRVRTQEILKARQAQRELDAARLQESLRNQSSRGNTAPSDTQPQPQAKPNGHPVNGFGTSSSVQNRASAQAKHPSEQQVNGTGSVLLSKTLPLPMQQQHPDNSEQNFSASMPPPPRPTQRQSTATSSGIRSRSRDVAVNDATSQSSSRLGTSRGVDMTKSAYFRLKAMGIDPPTDFKILNQIQDSGPGAGTKRTRLDEGGDLLAQFPTPSRRRASEEGHEDGRPAKRVATEDHAGRPASSPASDSEGGETALEAVLRRSRESREEVTRATSWMKDETRRMRRESAESSRRSSFSSVVGPRPSSRASAAPPKYRSRPSSFVQRGSPKRSREDADGEDEAPARKRLSTESNSSNNIPCEEHGIPRKSSPKRALDDSEVGEPPRKRLSMERDAAVAAAPAAVPAAPAAAEPALVGRPVAVPVPAPVAAPAVRARAARPMAVQSANPFAALAGSSEEEEDDDEDDDDDEADEDDEDDEGEEAEEGDEDDSFGEEEEEEEGEDEREPPTWNGKGGTSMEDAIEL